LGWSLLALVKRDKKSATIAGEHIARDIPTDSSSATLRVLNYARPRPARKSSYVEQASISAAIGGFFLGLGVCIASTVLLVSRMDSRSVLYPLIVLLAVLGTAMAGGMLGSKPGFKGLQPA